MHKGKRYWISCKQLGVAETKEGSIHAANAYWRAKQAELDARPPARPQVEFEDLALASLGKKPGETLRPFDLARLALREARERMEEEERLEQARELHDTGELPPGGPDEARRRLSRSAALWELEYLLERGALREEFARNLPPARVAQLEGSAKGFRGESDAPPERTVQANVDAWLATRREKVEAGLLAPDRHANVAGCLAHFTAFLGEKADIGLIDQDRLDGFYRFCLGKVAAKRMDAKAGWSADYARATFAVARTWIRWLWEKGTLEVPPRNLDSRGFTFGAPAKRVPTWTVEDVRRVIREAPGKLKLCLLLMVNIGATQADVSNLKNEEVRWAEGRVIRKRSKTRDCENVPTVNYKLWPSTFALLERYRSEGELALRTDSGKPYVRKELVNGKLVKSDNIASNYAHLKRRLKFQKPLKQLRKTAASLLESHETYGRLTSLFLGHSPRSMKDRSYAAPPRELLDEAVTWLGEQLGVADLESVTPAPKE
jgi:hypothetical protein